MITKRIERKDGIRITQRRKGKVILDKEIKTVGRIREEKDLLTGKVTRKEARDVNNQWRDSRD